MCCLQTKVWKCECAISCVHFLLDHAFHFSSGGTWIAKDSPKSILWSGPAISWLRCPISVLDLGFRVRVGGVPSDLARRRMLGGWCCRYALCARMGLTQALATTTAARAYILQLRVAMQMWCTIWFDWAMWTLTLLTDSGAHHLMMHTDTDSW